tara:strand:- start:20 stop:259 length:240 start_codon:yes stop_codon:yes gene_type:complete
MLVEEIKRMVYNKPTEMIHDIDRRGVENEISDKERERFIQFGVLPLCLQCHHNCKEPNAKGFTYFYCNTIKKGERYEPL